LTHSTPSAFSRQPLSLLTTLFPSLDFLSLSQTDLNADLLQRLLEYPEQHRFSEVPVSFVCQDSLVQDDRYYEQIIFDERTVPTRKSSWHDFFNGLIWLSFPKTKSYLNQLHISEIEEHGANPRTKARNHLTHFDECGVVLFIANSSLCEVIKRLLEEQLWARLFCELSKEWHVSIHPLIFGHANLEMLLNPFIGLTAKVLLVNLENDAQAPITMAPPLEKTANVKSINQSTICQYHVLDSLLLKHVKTSHTFYEKKPFYPLPLLGIPGWHYAQQTAEFYADKNYFMPKRQR
jgi:hypothetical protein